MKISGRTSRCPRPSLEGTTMPRPRTSEAQGGSGLQEARKEDSGEGGGGEGAGPSGRPIMKAAKKGPAAPEPSAWGLYDCKRGK